MLQPQKFQIPGQGSSSPDISKLPWNELLEKDGTIKQSWAAMNARFHSWTPEQRRHLTAESNRMLDDLGTTFNVYRDVGGAGQPYQIDPIPFIIDYKEWEPLSKGVAQRMRLLEAVLEDLYSNRNLLKDGLVPPDLVHASPAFHQATRDISPPGEKWLMVTGCDLIRGPQGTWTVLRDHTHTPRGVGQTLENRSVVSSMLPDLFDSTKVAKLKPFFDAEHETLETIGGPKTTSRLVFLTPGYRHPSYFEHAYKARLLGIPLVEAADLTVRERRLYLKTLGGLRLVDGVISRLRGNQMDPLEMWNSGGGGVPGLIEAWRSGNVAILNAPGSGFAGSPALQAFLPTICRKWFGEELLLPFVESWWLGQKHIAERILPDLSSYILLSAFGKDTLLPLRWQSLSAAAKREWTATIARRPWDFVVQRDVSPSLVPCLQGRGIQSKPVLLRSFCLAGTNGYTVLPGGLAKTGKAGHAPQLWPDHEGFTKDVWLTGQDSTPGPSIDLSAPLRRDRLGIAPEVPSRIAEQLYWLGRYVERVEAVTRMLRVTLRCMEGETGRRQRNQIDSCLALDAG